MANNELNTEIKILDAANSIFLLFGFHGTTLQQIATEAGVNKSVIHYYFRSKAKLYSNVIKIVFENIKYAKIENNKNQFDIYIWFLFTELYNNRELFVKYLMELYPDDWSFRVNKISEWHEYISNLKFDF